MLLTATFCSLVGWCFTRVAIKWKLTVRQSEVRRQNDDIDIRELLSNVSWNVLCFKCYLFFLAYPSHLPSIISPPSLYFPTFSLLSSFSPCSSTSFFPHTPLSSHLFCPLCPSSLNLLPWCHFINYSAVAWFPLLSSNLSPLSTILSSHLLTSLFNILFFFSLLYPAPFILLPFASPPVRLLSSVVHWLFIALWSWNATLTLSRPATESYWLEVWFKETTREFFQGLLNLSSQLRLEYRLFTNLDKVWISYKRSRKVTICLS